MGLFNNVDDIPEPFKKYSTDDNKKTNTDNHEELPNTDISTTNIKHKSNDFNDMLFILLILIIFFDNI